jgi:hypothetical protein
MDRSLLYWQMNLRVRVNFSSASAGYTVRFPGPSSSHATQRECRNVFAIRRAFTSQADCIAMVSFAQSARKVKGSSAAGPSFLDGHRHPWLYRAHNLPQICFLHQLKNIYSWSNIQARRSGTPAMRGSSQKESINMWIKWLVIGGSGTGQNRRAARDSSVQRGTYQMRRLCTDLKGDRIAADD